MGSSQYSRRAVRGVTRPTLIDEALVTVVAPLPLRLPDPCVVVLVGASGAGKSHWAALHLGASAGVAVVSSDALRGLVGRGEDDQRAGTDAFAVLDLVVSRRCRRRLTTVIDTTGLDADRRARWLQEARRHRLPAHVVVFATPDRLCRARNRQRPRPVPAKVLTGQLQAVAAVGPVLEDEGWDGVHVVASSDADAGSGVGAGVVLVPPVFLDAPAGARRQQEDPMALEFGLQINRFEWPGGPAELATRLGSVAAEAEEAGFASLWVMDHFLQIPVVGREWEAMPESYTTLGFLAGRTSRVRLGTLVTGVTYRNLAHLAKIVATLDVLSGGRAMCGLGAAWFEREHQLYGWDFPPVARRYELLEDALELLPLMWGPGSPAFSGRTVDVPAATCYPRPLQERVPIWVGGSGERRTLRLVAQHADGCNLFGDPSVVRHKLEVLRSHCRSFDRDPAEVHVSNLTTVSDAVPVSDHVGLFRAYAEAGVRTAIVSLPSLGTDPAAVARLAPVLAAFR